MSSTVSATWTLKQDGSSSNQETPGRNTPTIPQECEREPKCGNTSLANLVIFPWLAKSENPEPGQSRSVDGARRYTEDHSGQPAVGVAVAARQSTSPANNHDGKVPVSRLEFSPAGIEVGRLGTNVRSPGNRSTGRDHVASRTERGNSGPKSS